MHCGRFHLSSIPKIVKEREKEIEIEREKVRQRVEREREKESSLVSDGAMPKIEISLYKVRNLCNNPVHYSVDFEIFYGIYQHKVRARVLQQCM